MDCWTHLWAVLGKVRYLQELMKRCQHAVWGGLYKLVSVYITNVANVTGEQSQVQKPDAFAVQANNFYLQVRWARPTLFRFSIADGKKLYTHIPLLRRPFLMLTDR